MRRGACDFPAMLAAAMRSVFQLERMFILTSLWFYQLLHTILGISPNLTEIVPLAELVRRRLHIVNSAPRPSGESPPQARFFVRSVSCRAPQGRQRLRRRSRRHKARGRAANSMTEPVEGEVASAAFWTLLECNEYAVAIYSLQLTLFVSARKTLESGFSESWTHPNPSFILSRSSPPGH